MIETTITRDRSRVQSVGHALRQYLDVVAGGAGSMGVLASIIVISSWPWALLVASIALLVVALVMPRWD